MPNQSERETMEGKVMEISVSYSHCPRCGQQVMNGKFLCGHDGSSSDQLRVKKLAAAFNMATGHNMVLSDPPSLQEISQLAGDLITERAAKQRAEQEVVEVTSMLRTESACALQFQSAVAALQGRIAILNSAVGAFLDDARKHTGALWTKNHELTMRTILNAQEPGSQP